ncbi:MAG: YdcF family protein [Pirellulaceae bacterium]
MKTTMTEAEQKQSRWLSIRTWSTLALAAVGGALAALFHHDRLMFEKLIVELVMPACFVWLCLLAVASIAWFRGQTRIAWILFALWILYGVTGNTFLADQLLATLEERYNDVYPLQSESPYDYVIVLGGGTYMAPNHSLQLRAGAGNRVVLAARMYHRGLAKHIICTGIRLEGFVRAEDGSPAQQATQMLEELGVNSSDISQIGGRNTYEELQGIAERFSPTANGGPAPHIGVISSAYHLPRVMRLADAVGVKVDPLPAEFQREPTVVNPITFLPTYSGFRSAAISLREYLAYLVKR